MLLRSVPASPVDERPVIELDAGGAPYGCCRAHRAWMQRWRSCGSGGSVEEVPFQGIEALLQEQRRVTAAGDHACAASDHPTPLRPRGASHHRFYKLMEHCCMYTYCLSHSQQKKNAQSRQGVVLDPRKR